MDHFTDRNRYYAVENSTGLTHQSGADVTVRDQFLANGSLTNGADTEYRAIDDNFPVFGFAIDLGSISSTPLTTLFQLSLHQRNCIQFESGLNNVQQLGCLWNSYFSTDTEAVSRQRKGRLGRLELTTSSHLARVLLQRL